jgi:PAS domain S-box-containing protein
LFKYSTTPALLTHLKERRIVEVNDAWLQLFEYEREEAVGKRDFELSELTDKPENKAKLSELEKNGIIKSVEMEMLTKSHKKLTVLFNASVIKYDDVDYALITYQDITERKEPKRSYMT